MDEWMNDLMDEWMNEWMNDLMDGWMNEWMNEWFNGWVNEWMNEWTNEWMKSINDIKLIISKHYYWKIKMKLIYVSTLIEFFIFMDYLIGEKNLTSIFVI